MKYVMVTIGNRNFFTGKICIVGVSENFAMIESYKNEAFLIACKKLDLNPNECCVLSYNFLGEDISFINVEVA